MRYLLLLVPLLFTLAYPQSNDDCMQCHEDNELVGLNVDSTEISMYVDLTEFKASIHGEFNCIDCHQDLEGIAEYPHDEVLKEVSCINCHGDIGEIYNESKHGLKFINMEELAPNCWGCHGTHNILPASDPSSMTYFQKLPYTCCGCHSKRNLAQTDYISQPCNIEDYLRGVHGRLVMEGNDSAPSCNTCHPAHDIRKRIDPQSKIYKLNISNLCGECHVEELEDYAVSIHFRALRHGIFESATCIDCHQEHLIVPRDSAYFATSHDACVECHNDSKLLKKYGLSENVVSTYEDSYHGLSVQLRSEDAATCASCHGNHEIFEANEPSSTVNEAHLVETCSKCHEGVTESFAKSYTHEAMLVRQNPINYFIRLIYTILIIGVVGAMLIHNLIIFVKYIRYKKSDEKQFYVVRFRFAEIFQHAILMLSFTILAISGFALRFPNAWWVQGLVDIGLGELTRGLIHRIAAVALIAISFYHLFYIGFTKRGKHLFRYIMLRFNDLPEVIQTLKYYLGLSKTKPLYDEFDYTEKVEYWAVVWGTIVMGLTGVILWFPTLVTANTPSWIVRASELIHYYEAILACLSIVVFHLFFVIAHPEQYPMNLSWLTGKMSLTAALRKHPIWIKRLIEKKEEPDLLPEVIQSNCKTVTDVEQFIKKEDSRDNLT
jgi:cytochrome b subunit of formate dehydrogenase